MSEPSESAGPRPPKRNIVSSLNALDLALASQQIANEMREFLTALLPLLNGVEKLCRGLETQPPEVVAAKAEQLALLADLADQATEQIGLARFGVAGECVDRTLHEVVDTVRDADRPHGTIVDVLEPGWLFQGQPLRCARVAASVRSA